jgi:guanosine-3',5'-bis(diphosphate) 3'-pyrophosphohydrolase
MAEIRWDLEDLAFELLDHDEYEALSKKIRRSRKTPECQIPETERPQEEARADAGLKPQRANGRFGPSTARRAKEGRPCQEIDDLMAICVTTNTLQDCCAALGVIYRKEAPISTRSHDRAATPKSNSHQWRRTSVLGSGGAATRSRSAPRKCNAPRD